jgi:hypothetical protein
MPRSAEDVETFLYRLNRNFDGEQGLFLVSSGSAGPPIAVRVDDPIVVVRCDIGTIPSDAERQNALFRRLLEYNSTDLAHAAYGLEGENIVLTAALELENLDMNELAAALSDIDVALATHIATLSHLARDADAAKTED